MPFSEDGNKYFIQMTEKDLKNKEIIRKLSISQCPDPFLFVTNDGELCRLHNIITVDFTLTSLFLFFYTFFSGKIIFFLSITAGKKRKITYKKN